MNSYQYEFIEFAIAQDVLRFGEFKLKSGRISPYFFNSGLFNNGEQLSKLGDFYAEAIQASNIEYDMLFGPAYKGIPLVSSVAISMANKYERAIPYCFDRKEAKDHGEGGVIVGSPLSGKVLIIDDVITAGTSVRYSLELIQQNNAKPIGVMIALDRQERGLGDLSAVEEVRQNFSITVASIITMENLIEYLQERNNSEENLDAIIAYKGKYGTY
jgi:orotate phosphoribosyltransferase